MRLFFSKNVDNSSILRGQTMCIAQISYPNMKDLTNLTIFGPKKSEILILEDYNESELTFYGNFLFKLSSPQHFEGSYKFAGHLVLKIWAISSLTV